MLHHLKLSDGVGEWVLGHRAVVLLAIGLATVAAVAACWHVPVRVSIVGGLMSDEAEYRAYIERATMLGGDSDALLYVATREGDQLFTPRVLDSIRAAARELQRLPDIESVVSIVDAYVLTPGQHLSPREVAARAVLRRQLAEGHLPDIRQRSITLKKYWPDDESAKARVDMTSLRQAMRQDPVAGRLLARDGGAQMMLVWLAGASALHDKPQTGVRRSIEEVLHRHGLGREGIYSTGTLVIQDWMFDEVIRAFVVVLPVVVLIVSSLVWLIFHRPAYVLITLAVAAIAISWSLGVVSFVFGELTLLVAATPALILIISTSDTVHLASAYVEELRQGLPREQAIRKVFREVGGACVLTSLTTFVGFLSLLVVPAATLRHMAVACAVGVAGALLLALTLVPMALMIAKPPTVTDLSRRPSGRWISAFVRGCQRLSLGWPKSVVTIHLVLIVVALMFASRLDYDADLPSRFAPSHPLRQSIDFFNNQMVGTTTVEVIVSTESENLLAPEMIAGLNQFDEQLRRRPEVQDVISILNVLRILDGLVGLQTPDGLPQNQKATEATVEVARTVSPEAIQALVSEEGGLLRVAVQVEPTRVLQVLRYAEQIAELARKCLPSGAKVETAGYYPVVGNAVREVLRSQVHGFFLCFFTVMTVVAFGVRSLRLGLLAMLPNIFPLALFGGVLALSFDMVDSDFLGIAIVSLGLAVDDTIHFLHRYDVERTEGVNRRTALERTFDYTGNAILRTTIILGVGLTPFCLSGYLSIHVLGTYLVFVLACAVFGDLLMLPALVLLFGGDNGLETLAHDGPSALPNADSTSAGSAVAESSGSHTSE